MKLAPSLRPAAGATGCAYVCVSGMIQLTTNGLNMLSQSILDTNPG